MCLKVINFLISLLDFQILHQRVACCWVLLRHVLTGLFNRLIRGLRLIRLSLELVWLHWLEELIHSVLLSFRSKDPWLNYVSLFLQNFLNLDLLLRRLFNFMLLQISFDRLRRRLDTGNFHRFEVGLIFNRVSIRLLLLVDGLKLYDLLALLLVSLGALALLTVTALKLSLAWA